MTNSKEGGTTVTSPAQENCATSSPAPSENQLRYLWDTLFRLRKKVRFYQRETEYLKAILDVVYEPEKLRLALAKYNEWRETQILK